jgi:hypothetical protein
MFIVQATGFFKYLGDKVAVQKMRQVCLTPRAHLSKNARVPHSGRFIEIVKGT